MSDFLNFFKDNTFILLIGFVFFCIALKEVVEFVQWAKEILNNWYEKRKKNEKHDENLQEEIEKLKTYVQDDKAQIRGLEAHLSDIDEVNKEQNKTLESLSIDVRDMRLESMRTKILDAVPKCADMTKIVSIEEYKIYFKLYEKYESILEANGLQNGEIDLAINLIKHSWEQRTLSNNFTEYNYLPPETVKEKIRTFSNSVSGFWEISDYYNLKNNDEK